MATYELRYFFDYGSGICLWSSNEAARIRFGYPVELDDLSLPPSVIDVAFDLMQRFDMSLDWDNPSGPSVWSHQDRNRFAAESQALLQRLSEHLGGDFRIKDERKMY
jgi:hypothetical protein